MLKLFVCVKCKKSFEKKSDYKKHIEKKNPCCENVSDTNILEKCEYCLNKFSKLELKKHLDDESSVCYFKFKKRLEYECNLYEQKEQLTKQLRSIEDKVDKIFDYVKQYTPYQ